MRPSFIITLKAYHPYEKTNIKDAKYWLILFINGIAFGALVAHQEKLLSL